MSSFILPQAFLDRMSSLLGPDYPGFLKSYEETRTNGLRVNTLKITPPTFLNLGLFTLEPVLWAEEGFYCDYTQRPGQHPYHAAGVYYLQEPSAMAVVAYLDPKPGEWVLDLAAAPGGKTTQIASRLQQTGLLWANEIVPSRAKILASNLDRWGAINTIISNETPERLADHLTQRFDKVLVDAPCSGEGMFRKDPDAVKEWSPESVVACATRQSHILESAARLVRPGGRLVYSTCTFSLEENEETIFGFLERHPDFSPLPLPAISEGITASPELMGAFRLYPHKVRGEGHFIAVLHKENSAGAANIPVGCSAQEIVSISSSSFNEKKRNAPKKAPDKTLNKALDVSLLTSFSSFVDGALLKSQQPSALTVAEEKYVVFGNHLYLNPAPGLSFAGLRLLRPGLHLGEIKPGRFQPGYALAHTLKPDHVQTYLSLPCDDQRLALYLHGESWAEPGPDGWVLIGVDGFPLGWAKRSQGQLKNHYPKELRS